MARIELKDVKKRYGSVEVLRDVNLDIEDGEFIVLVGPSGCGKSTLLRMIAGLEPITGGDFLIDGKRMNDVRPRDRDIAMVFQSYALYPHMDVARNMGFSMEIRKDPAAERASRVKKAAETLGLTALTERLPKALSGGQRQRVAMGRAIIRDPRAFLFDEPLSNLDAALRVEMRLEIARLHQKLGATMIYVTHDQVEALTLADRIVVLNGGDIQQVGSPLELYERPANKFVAQFIGSPTMNIVPVTGGDGEVKTADGSVIKLPHLPDCGAAVELGIRPEHIDVVDPSEGDLIGVADVVEHLGSDTNIFTVVEGLGPLMVRKHGNIPAKSGDRLGLRIQPENAHIFGPDGRALRRVLEKVG
ncbi:MULTISPECIES: ABC transporter ATP-binding protein [Halocynthiibacter]|uniref:Sn-glycerol-3-phosphate ABC transporter ATP-binding protein UgpC n=1 Tax=Halocynthiibacter halioticoli TaxID=2986804 RepID=A0AAE3LS52_9RHOB|nr:MULTISPECIES: sn-glycerol-3-phosphate ABC transporter ATP-binding protein UgpC [Halocynthiibacter]MCV6822971.1 sn-glycerol-3-phosphate ABC transporter ATP-binding protein UgpC [Halocynthiibacter halioticoli]MCW4055972.1 sn-glycerol-3-phosphate ABC transporter ATP-binding protein UgpC [Halocynthiibacter sp. SDUM655004]